MLKKNLYLITIIAVVLFISSCGRNIRYIYQKEKKETKDSVYLYKNLPTTYRLKKRDVLHIKISTNNENINKEFVIDKQATNSNNNDNSGREFYLSGYTVNDTGYVRVPVLGDFKIEGLTISEVRTLLQKETEKRLKGAILNIRLVSFKVSFLGELKKEGTIFVYQESLDILEGIARMGGITNYGNKKNVVVRREVEGGYIIYRIDLRDRNILESERFYLHPNDMVIVEPLKSKMVRVDSQIYTFFLSVLSSTITTIFLVLQITNRKS